ncbi:MAG: cytidylyltransferase domain-containing protein, partial [Gaiellaceae bacterium]
IDLVVIDTDSDLIAEEAAAHFPGVRVVERPAHLRGGDVPMNDVLLHDIDIVDASLYLQTHSTNPLLKATTISRAVDAFEASRDRYDSLFSVTALRTRLWTQDGEAINHDPNLLLRTQDLAPVMEENSCLYLFAGETLRRRGNRIGERPLLFELTPTEAWDIDDETDWTIVEALYEHDRLRV